MIRATQIIVALLMSAGSLGIQITKPSQVHINTEPQLQILTDKGRIEELTNVKVSEKFATNINWTISNHCCNEHEVGSYGPANENFTGPGGPIPNIVFTMGPYRPEEIEAENKKMFPEGTEFRYFNHNELWDDVKMISKHLEEEVGIFGAADAFKKFRPHSYQSDLWRPMMLWEYGGYYLDAKIQLTKPIETWVDRDRDIFAVCRDLPLSRDSYPIQPDYWSAMLAAPKRSPMVLPIIQKLIFNANNQVYPVVGRGNNIGKLYVAGPGAFTDALHEAGQKPAVRCTNHEHTVTDLNGETVAMIVEDVHKGMRTCEDCDAYGQLFKVGQAYCAQDGPPCRQYD